MLKSLFNVIVSAVDPADFAFENTKQVLTDKGHLQTLTVSPCYKAGQGQESFLHFPTRT